MKNQALFSSKDKSKILKCCLLQFLFGALRIKNAGGRANKYEMSRHIFSSPEGAHRLVASVF